MVTRSKFNSWSPQMQARYRQRYGNSFLMETQPAGDPKASLPGAKPPPAAPPIDPIYDAQVGTANRRRDDALAFLDQDERTAIRTFGLDDTSDPFSRARMLQRSYEQRRLGNTNSMAARGQLYSGALQNQQNETEFQRLRGVDSLRKEQDDILARIRQRRAGVNAGHEEDIIAAGSDRIGRAIQSPPDASELPPVGELSSRQPSGALPAGYRTWSLQRKRRYWQQRRAQRGN